MEAQRGTCILVCSVGLGMILTMCIALAGFRGPGCGAQVETEVGRAVVMSYTLIFNAAFLLLLSPFGLLREIVPTGSSEYIL